MIHCSYTILLMALGTTVHAGPPPELNSVAIETTGQVTVRNAHAVLHSPEEGLWSIATGWEDDWPAEWHHAHPETVEQVGDWTIVRGRIALDSGEWRLTDAYRQEEGLLRCTRRFEWHGAAPLEPCTLSIRFQAGGAGAGVVMPGLLYHGNPSGAKSGRTPVYTGAPGEEAFFEEHRFPMPFASFEWREGDNFSGAALHSLPCPVPGGNRSDQWWSLGVTAKDGHTELALLSGPCASNGRRSVIKAVQPGFEAYTDTWLVVPPGAIIEKTFYLDVWPVAREGAGFQRSVSKALDLYPPVLTPDLPAARDIINGKLRYAETRWLDMGSVAGYRKYHDRSAIVMGWCGQAAAPAYALPVLADHFDIPYAQDRAQRSLDFLTNAVFYEGGFHTWYHPERQRWERHEPLSQGQAMLHFADAIRLGRETDMDTTRWEAFLRRACDFHSARILDADWAPASTDQAFFIAPLCEAARLFDVAAYRKAAVKAGETYAARSVTMREPYWGGTLDASCEDKEGAYAALQGFVALYDATGEDRYLEWARHALDVVLTYLVVWDIDMPPGRLRNHGFRTRGWTAVSPQNQHIDVFGVLIAPWVYRMGELTENATLKDTALLMFRSCGQLMDPWGSQGEQPQQTSYAQRGEAHDVEALRGDYVEDWTVFWITAHFLNAAARFIEMNAPLLE